MKFPASHFTLGLIAAAALTLTACGGGSGGSDDGNTTAMTTVTPTVMDGLISNAVVCWDANDNGMCDATETQGTTDSTGKATLFIPTASVATAKLLAVVTAGVSSDADTGLVATTYTLRATAGKHTVISPLTDMAQAKIAADSTQTFEKAQAAVLSELGLSSSISVTDNFIAKRDTDSNYKDAGVKARTLVLVKQAGAKTATNCPVVSADAAKVDAQFSKTLTTELESIKSGLANDDGVRSACSSTGISSECDTALKTKAAAVVASCTTTAASTTTTAAASTTPATSTTAAASTTPATSTTAAATSTTPTTSPTTAASTTPATSTTTTAASTTPTTTTTTTPTTPTATVTSAVNGKALYAANTCAACHGVPPSSNKVLNGANNPSRILNAINSGTGGMGMYIGKFSTQELTDMAAYLATPRI